MHPSINQNVQFEAGVFSQIADARKAVHGLFRAGFAPEQITVICSDATKERYFREFEHEKPAGSSAAKAAVAGGSIGAALGGLSFLASAPAVAATTVALWAAGPIVAVAGAGAVVGGLVGAMMTRGVERELADYYQQAVVEGRILVAAEREEDKSQPTLAQAAKALAEAGAEPLPLREG